MAHLHNFTGQAGVIMGNIGQKVKQTAEIGQGLKTIYQIGSFFKNAILPAATLAAEVAAVAL
jgi:hypothetical protein